MCVSLTVAAMVTCMELSVGGFGWIPNLLVPDESLILPVSLGLINLAVVEVWCFYLPVMCTVRIQSRLFSVMGIWYCIVCYLAALCHSCLEVNYCNFVIGDLWRVLLMNFIGKIPLQKYFVNGHLWLRTLRLSEGQEVSR